MKNRILAIVLAVVLIGTAIFFAVYQKYGTTFDYAKKDMSKYINISLNDVKNADDKSVEHETAEEKDAEAYIASLLADYEKLELDKKYEGVIGKYDTVFYFYYVTLKDEEGNEITISKATHLDPTVSVKNWANTQMCADDDLARAFADLIGKDIKEYSYNYFVSGELFEGDNLRFDFERIDKDGKVVKDTDRKGVLNADLDNAKVTDGEDTVFGAGFYEALKDATIGSKKEITLGEDDAKVTYNVTVNYVTRDTVVGGSIKNGDVVYLTYKDSDGKETTYHHAIGGTENTDAYDEKFGTGFAAALEALTIGAEDFTDITVTVTGEDGATTEKVVPVKVTGVYRADKEGTEEADIKRAEVGVTFDRTYEEDAKDTAETDSKIELKGKTVTYHIFPVYFYDAELNLETIVHDLNYTSDEDVKDTLLAKYLDAYHAWDENNTSYTDLNKEYEDAKEAYEAAKAEDSGKTADEIKELEDAMNTAKEKADKAKTALDESKTDLDKAAEEYAKEKEVEVDTLVPEEIALEEFGKYALEKAQDLKDQSFREKLAEVIWNNLLKTVKNNGVNYPKKAVKLAYKALIDEQEEEYYENRSAKYSEYKNFKAFLVAQKGEDYKDVLTREAEEIVLAKLVLYRLVELYDVSLSTAQESLIAIYVAYLGYNESEMRAARLFDNAVEKLTEDLYPEIFKEDAKEDSAN